MSGSKVRLTDLEGRATISVDELASVLQVGRATAYEAVRTNAVRSLRIGRVIRIPVPALLETLGANGGSSPTLESPEDDDGR